MFSHVIHAIHQHAGSFAIVVKCISAPSRACCFFGNRTLSWCEQWQVLLPLPDCRQGLLTCYLCLFSVSHSSYLLFLASLMIRCLCLVPICMFTLQPWYSHFSPHPINLLIVSLASRSACLGVDCGLSHTLLMFRWYSLINEDLLCGYNC